MKTEIEARIWSDINRKQMSSWGKWLYVPAALGLGWLALTSTMTLSPARQAEGRSQQTAVAIEATLCAAGGYMLRRRSGYVSLVNTYQNACSNLLGGKVDYWYADTLSAIAVSVAEGKVALIEDRGQLGSKVELGAYDAKQITDVQMMQYQSLGSTGSLTGDTQQNIARMQQIARDGGLRVSVADIDTPQYRIRMGERSGQKWAEVINQLLEGTLPPSPQPKRIA